MRGTARTVFRGTEPEEFNVEIFGVVPGAIGPKQDLIIGKLSGGGADRTHVFAGMSGSPVYIDGKLVGAISYSFPFSKEPICGITPIEQMISIFEQNHRRKTNAQRAARRFVCRAGCDRTGNRIFRVSATVSSSVLTSVNSAFDVSRRTNFSADCHARSLLADFRRKL